MKLQWLLSVAFASGFLVLAGCGAEDPPNRHLDTGAADTGGVDTEPTLAGLGEACVDDDDCDTDQCASFDGTKLCTTSCSGDAECVGSALSRCYDGKCAPATHCVDDDGDGYGEGPGCEGADCADDDASVHPGAEELCGDDVDNDCDGTTDEGHARQGDSCVAGAGRCQRAGTLECTDDGLDLRCSADPGESNSEACNGLDDDCDGQIDEDIQCKCRQGDTQPCYPGASETRGVGRCRAGTQTCQKDGTWGTCDGAVTPEGRQETCNGLDDDCNGIVDDVDEDGDGFYGCPGVPNPDCDDKNDKIHPGALEDCNKRDDNCNGLVDEGIKTTYYLDKDGDGWGMEAKSTDACQAPKDYVDKTGDCNDNNDSIHPGATEVCNDLDNDCDGKVDDGLKKVTLYRDADGDKVGAPNGRTRKKCLYDRDGDGKGDTPPVGWSTENSDCDDSNATVYPDAPELCDGILNDCSVNVADWACPTACGGNWPTNSHQYSLAPTPVQLDGDTEFELIHSFKRTVAWEHDGSVKWTHGAGHRWHSLADFDKDGTFDVAVRDGAEGDVFVIDGRNGETMKRISASSKSGRVRALDIDGDTNIDIAYPGKLILLKSDLSVKKRVTLDTIDPRTEFRNDPTFLDFDDDGSAEIVLPSSFKSDRAGCDRQDSSCHNRLYVFNHDGSYYNDPNWSDPNRPHFKPHRYPDVTIGDPRILDLEGDGTLEIAAGASQRASNKSWGEIWELDGTHDSNYTAGTGGREWMSRRSVAPVDPNGKLAQSRKLRSFTRSSVVDMNDDGIYEWFVRKNGGLRLKNDRQGVFPDTKMVPVPGWSKGAEFTIEDIDRDGGLEVLYADVAKEKTYCYEFPTGTFSDSRVLSYNRFSPIGRYKYPTRNHDPYEPNDRGPGSFDPKQTNDPIRDSRAVHLKAFRHHKSGRWRFQLRAMISSPDDVDFYWIRSRGSNHRGDRGIVSLNDLERDYDIKLHVYRDTSPPTYIKTLTSARTGTKSERTFCRPERGNCPPGQKLFIIEVHPKTPSQDFGPFPYRLTYKW